MLLMHPPAIDEPSTRPFIGQLCLFALFAWASSQVFPALHDEVSIWWQQWLYPRVEEGLKYWSAISAPLSIRHVQSWSELYSLTHLSNTTGLSPRTGLGPWTYPIPLSGLIRYFTARQVAVLVFLVPLICTVGYGAYNVWFHPLRKVPGPRMAAFTPFWQVKLYLSGRSHLEHIRLHEIYGPLVRISPNTVIINDPAYFTAHSYWDKSLWWLAFRGDPTHLGHVSYLDLKSHVQRKKLVQGGYQGSAILKNEPAVDQHVVTMIEQIKNFDGSTFDITPWSQYLTFDVVLEMMFGEPLHFLKLGRDVDDIIKTLQPFLIIVNVMALLPTLSQIILTPVFFKWLVPKPDHSRGIGRLHRVAYDQIERRHKDLDGSARENHDVLQWIINKNQSDTQTALPWKLLEQEMVGPILAASDSGACVIRTAMLYISTNGRVLSRLVSEIDAADQQGFLSRPVPKFREVRKHVPYLDLVIKETMRIYPPTGIPLPRSAPGEGTTIHGHFIPGGTSVGISQWAVGRSRYIFGEDANVFRPERWLNPANSQTNRTAIEEELDALDVDPNATEQVQNGGTALTAEQEAEADRRRKLRDLAYMPFSLGPMQCTGRNVAMVEIYKTMTQLYRQFDIQVVDPTKPWKDVNRMPMVQWDFWVRMNERSAWKERGN